MKLKRFWIVLLILSPWIVGIFCSMLSKLNMQNRESLSNPSSEKEEIMAIEKATIVHNPGGRGRPSSFDATDQLVFFAYTENAACVDAYNYRGEYQFTIQLSGRERGAVSIRCHENLLYISSKYQNVFVFDDDYMVKKLSPLDRKDQDLSESWFEARGVPLEIKNGQIIRYSISRKKTSVIDIPAPILVSMYIHQIYILAILISFILFIVLKSVVRSSVLGSGKCLLK